MSEHSVFPIEKEKTVKEFQELVQKYLDNPKEIGLLAFSKKHVGTMAILVSIMQIERNKFRDHLIVIRTLLDENPVKGKQKLTNLIKELK